MKRQLILIRHTKSSWSDFSIADFDRPLKKDRVEDAKNIATKLKLLKLEPDLVICSPAKRTRQTAEYFYDKLKYEEGKVQFDKRIYESSAQDLFEVIRKTSPEVKTLVVIGHNPSLTNFANYFMKEKIDEMPTTGVVWLELENKDWEIDRQTPCKLKYFLTPKDI